ncbi:MULTISPECIES: hypothetical protein [unclassified Lactococcus]|uniref:hypothetical protein n=1 Tax=unclassified Lactococcus TaxID=2643510 RepID=UPI0011C8B364|nr:MULTISPECIES: hypothetical protein [unclassified Lactococcus]MQW24054.1 hypothetical protein [Lactococcus sp. dk101]TXK36503.1 hypothetical protein FVP42_11240 [Lactococcus sp. dk310]TXK47162.1 hypothetical protein FVP43_10400 [Lactococcus sp. dk322]
MISKHLGINPSSYSFGYLANWIGKKNSVDDFESSLKVITKQSQYLIEEIDKTYEKVFDNKVAKNKFEERLSKAQNQKSTKQVDGKTKENRQTQSKM